MSLNQGQGGISLKGGEKEKRTFCKPEKTSPRHVYIYVFCVFLREKSKNALKKIPTKYQKKIYNEKLISDT